MSTFGTAYRQKLEALVEEERRLPAMQAEAEGLRNTLHGLSITSTDTRAFFSTREQLAELEKRIRGLESGELLSNMLLDAIPYIKAVEADDLATLGAREPAASASASCASATAAPAAAAAAAAVAPPPPAGQAGIERFIQISHRSSAGSIAKSYADGSLPPSLTEPGDRRGAAQAHVCQECDSSLLVNTREALLVCTNCGRCQSHLDLAAANMTFADRQAADVLTTFSYRRENHFSEWLASVQGKEGTDVPAEVIAAVRGEVAKERIFKSGLSPKIVRSALKKLGFSKYFDSSPSICYQLGGPKPAVIGTETEARFKEMFSAIQAPFAKHCPAGRRNFLSYSYCLNRMAQLIERDDLLPCFPLLKSADKLFVQDQVWRLICQDLGWQFIRSV